MSNSIAVEQPPVGWPVVFYIHADTSTVPVPGTVVSDMGKGMVGLSGICGEKRLVYHVADRQLVENPPLKQRYGGWDYIEGMEYHAPDGTPVEQEPKPVAAQKEAATKDETTDERRSRIKENIATLHAMGYGTEKIIEEVKESGVNAGYVRKVVKSLSEEPELVS